MGIYEEHWAEEDALICDKDKKTLEQARQNYGFKNQISVANEELKELAILCDKYQRYSKHETAVEKLKEQVIDEYADVVVILDHVKAIFGLTDADIRTRAYEKIDRLRRWMKENPSFEHTTVDREVIQVEAVVIEDDETWNKEDCIKCRNYGDLLACNWCENGNEFSPLVSLTATPKDIQKAIEHACVGCDIKTETCYSECKKITFLNEELDRAMSRL